MKGMIRVSYFSISMLMVISYITFTVVEAMPPCPDCDVAVPDIRFCGFYDNEDVNSPEVTTSSYYGKLRCDHGSERCTSDDDCVERIPYVKCLRECGPQL
jgi:hypothetical protein